MLYSNPITCSFPNTVHQWFSSPCSLWGAKVWISLSHSVRRLQPTWLHHWGPPVRVIYPGVRVVWPHSLLSTPCPFHSCCSFRNPLSWPLTVCTRAGSTLDSKEESRQGSSSCRKLGWSGLPATTSRTDKWGSSWLPRAVSRTAPLELCLFFEINGHSSSACFPFRMCPWFSRERAILKGYSLTDAGHVSWLASMFTVPSLSLLAMDLLYMFSYGP